MRTKAKKTKNIIAQYDFYILSVYIILTLIGLFMQLNISSIRTSMTFFYKQSIWFAISLVTVWLSFKMINLEKSRKFIFITLLLTIIALILVLVLGHSVKGAQRSIRFFGVSIQPSLFARIILILYFAHIFDKKKDELDDTSPKQFLKKFSSLIIFSISIFGLILIEKHLSILIILGFTLFWMLWLAKIKLSTIFSILGILVIFMMGVLLFGKEDYRRERLKIYKKYSLFHKANPEEEIYTGDKDYQIRESLISLASGKYFGTTSKRGTGKHYFLPEAKTDYIYAIIGEEFGFLWAVLILAMYAFIFYRTLINGSKNNSLYLKLASYGLGMNIFFNAMVNIGVAMSALPSTGVTLPFISYGGTSLLVNSFSIGLLLNISAVRRNISR
ncbi:MAG: FtsW/RodA/SpoVE family cell cycle protein [Candidatus Cloacimonetes bacterium]|nr:FtsW/RodA/SpoVE family cell cycle protein [Candidatus Cloacimonadota bacterium]